MKSNKYKIVKIEYLPLHPIPYCLLSTSITISPITLPVKKDNFSSNKGVNFYEIKDK